jgi:oxygen-independent coproporphyrinogen-3 oxidase
VETAIALGIPHLSCYALTVEAKTPLQKMIRQGKLQDVDPDKQSEQFSLLMNWLETAGYEQYEISNFARPGFRSRHNSSYWQGKKYLGIGPSAHSYDRESRQWNVSNNQQYIASIRKGIIPFEREVLTPVQQLNEYIMTSLRTGEGLDLSNVEKETKNSLTARATKYVNQDLAMFKGDFLVLTKEGRLLADGIAAALFFDQ